MFTNQLVWMWLRLLEGLFMRFASFLPLWPIGSVGMENILTACSFSNSLTFIQYYLRDLSFQHEGIHALGPLVRPSIYWLSCLPPTFSSSFEP